MLRKVMDIKGIVIAVSEILRLESEHIILLKIYNKYAGATFHILIQDQKQFYWKNEIIINSWYQFSNLKIDTWNEGTKQEITLLKTSCSSEFFMVKKDNCKDESYAYLEQAGLIKCVNSFPPEKAMQALISYEGYVTSIKDESLGLYELDKKLLLYTTFLKFASKVPHLKIGFKILVCNAHLFHQETKMMVCCGISSLKILEHHMKSQENIKDDDGIQLIHKLALTFYDVIWLEGCFQQLCKKFYPSIIPDNDNPFSWSSCTLETILYTLIRCGKNVNCKEHGIENRSSIHEFVSSPHTCTIFPEIKNFGFELPLISDVLSNAEAQISWVSCNASWNCCTVNNSNSTLLVGLLHLAKDGNFYVVDESKSVLCIFSADTVNKECSFTKDTCHQNSISEMWQEALIGTIIILKDFQIVFEVILDQNVVNRELIYICTDISSVIPFYKLVNLPSNLPYKHLIDMTDVSKKKPSQNKTTISKPCIGPNSFKSIVDNNHFVKAEGLCKKQSECSNFISQFARKLSLKNEILGDSHQSKKKSCSRVNLCEQFLFIGKTLPLTKNSILYQKAVVLLQRKGLVEASQDCFADLAKEFSSLLDLEDKYYTPLSNNSPRFSDNISSNLKFIREINEIESKLVILNFKGSSLINCATLLPEHNYLMVTPTEINASLVTLNSEESANPWKEIAKDYKEYTLIEILPETVFFHLPLSSNKITSVYENIPNVLSLKKYSVSQLFADSCFMKYNIIRGIIVDKWFDRIRKDDQYYKGSKKKAFCIVLKDCVAPCSVRVYVHDFPDFVLGLLPDTVIEMFGLSFHQSEKGNAYLKSCGFLGLQIIKFGSSSSCGNESIKIRQRVLVPWNFFFKVNKSCQFKSLCFVLKIQLIEIFPVCSSCSKNVLNCCCSSSNTVIKTKAKFLVDDGSDHILVHCDENSIRHLFDITENEWQSLTTYVYDSQKPLIYKNEMLMEQLECSTKISQSLISRVFYNLCSSSVMKRLVVMDCRSYLDQPMMRCNSTDRKSLQQFRYFCVKLSEPRRDVALEFLNHLKKRLV